MPLDAARSRTRWSWPKRVIVAVAALVGVYVLWIGALNVALSSGFVARKLTGKYRLSSVELEYRSAWVVWPTHVHVEDLVLRIDAYRYQLELEVPEGEVDIALWELLARRFHAQSIVADGARVKFRSKSPPHRVSKERLAAFAEIEGMTDPVRWPGPPNVPEVEDAFEVILENVDGRLESLWVNELNFTPVEARLTGGIRSRAGHLFAIDDAGLDMRSGDLYIADELMAENWSGRLRADLLDYNPNQVAQRDVLGQLNLEVDAGADMVSISAMAPFVEGVPLRLGGGKGPLDIGLHVDRGVLMPDTEILYRTPALTFRSQQLHGRTGLRLAVGVDAPAEAARARAAAELHELAVAYGDSDEAITAERVFASLVAGETSLTAKELPIVGADLRVPKLAVDDLGALSGLAKDLDLRGGKAELSLHTKMPEPGRLGHELSGKVSGVHVRSKTKQVAVRASGEFSAQLATDAKLRTGESEELALTVRDLSLRTEHGESKDGWVEVKGGSVAWNAGKESIDARLKGRLDDLRPILSHVDDRKRLVELVPDLDITQPFHFDVEVRREGKVMDIRVHRFDRSGLEIEGIVHRVGQRSRSAFRMERARLGLVRDETREREIDAGANEEWLEQRIRWARELSRPPRKIVPADSPADVKAPPRSSTPTRRTD